MDDTEVDPHDFSPLGAALLKQCKAENDTDGDTQFYEVGKILYQRPHKQSAEYYVK